MVNSEDNLIKLKYTETKVTVGDRKNITGTKRGEWHGRQKRNGKIHHVTLTNTSLIPLLHAKLFRVMQALQKRFPTGVRRRDNNS